MFAADLSWADNQTEKVGERRERRARQRENSITGSTTSSSKKGVARKPSTSQTISFSSVKASFRRPSTAVLREDKKPPPSPIDTRIPLKDPLEQPDYIYSAKLDLKLPSGAPIDPPAPFQTADRPQTPLRLARSRHGSITRLDPHKAWSVANQKDAETICQSYQQVKDEILALQDPEKILPRYGTTFYDESPLEPPAELAAEFAAVELAAGPPQIPPKASRPRTRGAPERVDSPRSRPMLTLQSMEKPSETQPRLRSPMPEIPIDRERPPVPPRSSIRPRTPAQAALQVGTPRRWEIVQSQVEIRKILDSDSGFEDSIDEKRQSIFTGSHFQRFVRRMESAGPRIILERLKEEWDMPGDHAMSDELQLEKHLWALTAIHLQCMDRFLKRASQQAAQCLVPTFTSKKRRKILELDGNVGEVYQLSAIYPNSRIYHFTSCPKASSIPLPSQATQHTISLDSPTASIASSVASSAGSVLPLPYANSSMHYIRATRIPTLLPAAQIPQLLAECYRVLKPGGVMELRLMDAMPERRSMGPLLANWLDDHLAVTLEADFKCQRPVLLVPKWARAAGFIPLRKESHASVSEYTEDAQTTARCLRLPAGAHDGSHGYGDTVSQVGALVSRALWKDAWGRLVSKDYDEPWWWGVPEIFAECREWNTTWEVCSLFLVKDDEV